MTSKDFRDYVVYELGKLGDLICRPMMGEYLLYLNNVLFGGLYDGRVLIKRTTENAKFNLPEQIPYKGAKPMYFLEDLEDTEHVKEIIYTTCESLKK